jgi:hypothetical protein
MPEVDRAAERLRGTADVIAVNMSYTETDLQTVSEYLLQNDYSMPVAVDRTGELTRSHFVEATPTTLVFNSDGDEVVRRIGAVSADWIVRKVMRQLD